MKSNDDIFEGKSFQDLTKDIYKNTTDRKKQIDLLISEIHGFITTIDDVVLVAPIIREYMEVAVKNGNTLKRDGNTEKMNFKELLQSLFGELEEISFR